MTEQIHRTVAVIPDVELHHAVEQKTGTEFCGGDCAGREQNFGEKVSIQSADAGQQTKSKPAEQKHGNMGIPAPENLNGAVHTAAQQKARKWGRMGQMDHLL